MDAINLRMFKKLLKQRKNVVAKLALQLGKTDAEQTNESGSRSKARTNKADKMKANKKNMGTAANAINKEAENKVTIKKESKDINVQHLRSRKEQLLENRREALQRLAEQQSKLQEVQDHLEKLNDDKHELVIKLKQVLQQESTLKRQAVATSNQPDGTANHARATGAPSPSANGVVALASEDQNQQVFQGSECQTHQDLQGNGRRGMEIDSLGQTGPHRDTSVAGTSHRSGGVHERKNVAGGSSVGMRQYISGPECEGDTEEGEVVASPPGGRGSSVLQQPGIRSLHNGPGGSWLPPHLAQAASPHWQPAPPPSQHHLPPHLNHPGTLQQQQHHHMGGPGRPGPLSSTWSGRGGMSGPGWQQQQQPRGPYPY